MSDTTAIYNPTSTKETLQQHACDPFLRCSDQRRRRINNPHYSICESNTSAAHKRLLTPQQRAPRATLQNYTLQHLRTQHFNSTCATPSSAAATNAIHASTIYITKSSKATHQPHTRELFLRSSDQRERRINNLHYDISTCNKSSTHARVLLRCPVNYQYRMPASHHGMIVEDVVLYETHHAGSGSGVLDRFYPRTNVPVISCFQVAEVRLGDSRIHGGGLFAHHDSAFSKNRPILYIPIRIAA